MLNLHVTCRHIQCIFRKPKECKERHKNLMDRTAGDGADSAEDSGSSQPYPSTLPGIPKARIIVIFTCTFNLCFFMRSADFAKFMALFNFVTALYAGKCQTVVSTLARTNGRGCLKISF